MLTQEQYVNRLKKGVAKHGLRGYARLIGVNVHRLRDEITGDCLERKYGRQVENKVVAAIGLRRVTKVGYEPIDPKTSTKAVSSGK